MNWRWNITVVRIRKLLRGYERTKYENDSYKIMGWYGRKYIYITDRKKDLWSVILFCNIYIYIFYHTVYYLIACETWANLLSVVYISNHVCRNGVQTFVPCIWAPTCNFSMVFLLLFICCQVLSMWARADRNKETWGRGGWVMMDSSLGGDGMGWDGMRGSQCISFSFICLWGPHLVFSAHIRTHTHTHSSDIKLHCWDQSRQPQRPDLNTSWCKLWCRFDTEPKIPFAAKFTLLHFITPCLDLSTSTQGPVDTSDAEYSLSRQPLKAHSHTHNVVS